MLDGKLIWWNLYYRKTTATVPQITETLATGKLTNNGSYYSVRGKYDDIIIVNKKHGLSKDYNQVRILQLRQPLFVFVTI